MPTQPELNAEVVSGLAALTQARQEVLDAQVALTQAVERLHAAEEHVNTQHNAAMAGPDAPPAATVPARSPFPSGIVPVPIDEPPAVAPGPPSA